LRRVRAMQRRRAAHMRSRAWGKLCCAAFHQFVESWQRSVATRNLRTRRKIHALGHWWREWLSEFQRLRRLRRGEVQLVCRSRYRRLGRALGDWCGMAALRRHRMALGAAVARRHRSIILRHSWRWWLLVCEWLGMSRALMVQAGHRHARHCVVEWWALSKKAKGSRRIAWRASAITGFHLLDQHFREAVAVRRGVRVVEARRVYAIFERWRTVARERARVEGAVVRQLRRQRLWFVLGEWRNFADWRRGVGMLWERGERGEGREGRVGLLVLAVSGGSDDDEEAVSHEGAYAIGAARGGIRQRDQGGGRGGRLGLEWGAMQYVAAAARVRVRSSAIGLRGGREITKGSALVAWLALAYRRLLSRQRRILLSKMLTQFAFECSVVRRTTFAQVLYVKFYVVNILGH
jgi:hypothetical protein